MGVLLGGTALPAVLPREVPYLAVRSVPRPSRVATLDTDPFRPPPYGLAVLRRSGAWVG
jgi:hypothetical protein